MSTDSNNNRILPALIRRAHEAVAPLTAWSNGTPRSVADLADTCVLFMAQEAGFDLLNGGTGDDLTNSELAAPVNEVIDHPDQIVFDALEQKGTPRLRISVDRPFAVRWKHRVSLVEDGPAAYLEMLGRGGE
ncbi:MAG: hypothetical protein JF607_18405 [Burkholderiales bacterium]|jgi:nucleoside-diphosphate-sugar epimerase|nr:hypothetical protein [Burkholderiales bacterium]MBW8892243.1 hypothetical protein [Burkholderiales bacterium]